jgi:hypothetical protein
MGNEVANQSAGAAAVGREVTIKGVVVGERSYGSQRFALVRLNADDDCSYRGGVDELGTHGAIALQMETSASRALFERPTPSPAAVSRSVTDMIRTDPFNWDDFDSDPDEADGPATRLAITKGS